MYYNALILICISSYLINISLAESGYNSLDPWGDSPIASPLININDDIFTMPKTQITYSEVLSYYKRLLNLVFRRTAFKQDYDNPDEYTRSLHLRLSSDMFAKLLGTIETSDDLRKIDGLISTIFINAGGGLSERLYDFIEDWSYYFWMSLEKPHIKICLVTAFILLTILYFKYVSKHSTLQISLALILVLSYCWTYYEMYMEEDINRIIEMKKYPQPPPDCSVDSMSYLESWMYLLRKPFRSDSCIDYYMLTSKTTFEVINPGIVAIEMFTRMVTHPLTTGSKKVAESIFIIFDAIPFPWNWILFPIALLFLFLIIVLFACWGLGINVNINAFFHLFSFSINNSTKEDQSTKIEDVLKTLSESQLDRLSNIELKYMEILAKQFSTLTTSNEEKAIEYKVKPKSSPLKSIKADTSDNDDDEENIENIDSTNCLKPNIKNKITNKKVLNDLIKNVNDLENRLEIANKTIEEKLNDIKKNGLDVEH